MVPVTDWTNLVCIQCSQCHQRDIVPLTSLSDRLDICRDCLDEMDGEGDGPAIVAGGTAHPAAVAGDGGDDDE